MYESNGKKADTSVIIQLSVLYVCSSDKTFVLATLMEYNTQCTYTHTDITRCD